MKSSDKPWLFKKGQSGNPLGKPPGTLDFKTKWYRFIEKIAEKNDLTPEEVDEQLFAVAFKKAKDGDYNFYRDTQDRIHGRPQQKIDLNATIPEPILGGIAAKIAAKKIEKPTQTKNEVHKDNGS
jgi:hypothetical protein